MIYKLTFMVQAICGIKAQLSSAGLEPELSDHDIIVPIVAPVNPFPLGIVSREDMRCLVFHNIGALFNGLPGDHLPASYVSFNYLHFWPPHFHQQSLHHPFLHCQNPVEKKFCTLQSKSTHTYSYFSLGDWPPVSDEELYSAS